MHNIQNKLLFHFSKRGDEDRGVREKERTGYESKKYHHQKNSVLFFNQNLKHSHAPTWVKKNFPSFQRKIMKYLKTRPDTRQSSRGRLGRTSNAKIAGNSKM